MQTAVSHSRFRWVLLGMLSCVTILNFIDRQAVSILYPAITKDLHLPDQTYTRLVTLFLIAYTAMYAIGGWLVDWIGARNGLALALAWWSAATVLTALVHGAFWLEVLRIMLAVGQPLVFSAGVKACAEFFPTQQRALATGIFSAGSGVGALLATPLLSVIAIHVGWRLAMATPGIVGFILAPAWIWAYNLSPKLAVTPGEAVARAGWHQLIRQRKTWALVFSRAIGDPLGYFCFFWIPIYLEQARHLDLKQIALVGWIPFLFADLGSVAGGGLSDALIRRGQQPPRARILVLVGCAGAAPLGAWIGFVNSLWVAILLMGLIAFISQCWTTTTAVLATDIFPQSSVGRITGMTGTAGGLGATVFSQLSGKTLHSFGFAPVFASAALLVPAALILLVLMLRSSQPALTAQLHET